MTFARALACSWLALALLACADPDDGADDDAGDDIGEIDTPPESEAALRCAVASAPELAAISGTVGTVELGPCGHVTYHDDQSQGWLIEPDGTRSEFDHAANRVEFAPTGDLLAWETNLDGGLMLRDLLGGDERMVLDGGAADRFGFVPSFVDPQARGAWLWSCEQGVLEHHDPSASRVLAESVACGSVVASTGTPRLAFADQAGRVWLADLDANTQVGSVDLDYRGGDGGERDDSLWIDHDGEVVLHVAIEWQGDPDVDSSWPVELWSRVLDREGETILDEPTLTLRQAPRRGAPVFVLQQGTIRRLDAGAPSSVGSGLESAELAGSGELFYSTDADAVLAVELDLELPLTTIAEFTTPVELQPSSTAAMLGVEHHSEICILDDQGECDRILAALRLWDREAGLAPRVLLSSSPWNLEATLDDGSMLVIGAPVEAEGPTYEGEQPAPRVLWLDREGAIQAELPAGNGSLAIRQTFELTNDRVVFEYQAESGQGALMLARTSAPGFLSLAPDVDVALLQTWIDARAERAVFVAEQDGVNTLWFGALPE